MSLKAYTGLFLAGAGLCLAKYINDQKNLKKQENPAKIQDPIMRIEDLIKKYSSEFNSSKSLEKIVPRKFETEQDLEALASNLYYRKKNSHLSSLTKSLSQPIWDLLDRGGKRWRPILCMLIAELYGHKREEVYEIAALC